MAKTKKAKKDWDGDGKVESGSDEYMGVKDKAIKKAMGKKKPAKKAAKKSKLVKESAGIKDFIAAISGKKYALANKYLKAVIEDKIKNRIENAVDKPLF